MEKRIPGSPGSNKMCKDSPDSIPPNPKSPTSTTTSSSSSSSSNSTGAKLTNNHSYHHQIKGRSRKKLRDHHHTPSKSWSTVQARRVVVTYKKARCRRFVQNLGRSLAETYFLLHHEGGNFLDSNSFYKKNEAERAGLLAYIQEKQHEFDYGPELLHSLRDYLYDGQSHSQRLPSTPIPSLPLIKVEEEEDEKSLHLAQPTPDPVPPPQFSPITPQKPTTPTTTMSPAKPKVEVPLPIPHPHPSPQPHHHHLPRGRPRTNPTSHKEDKTKSNRKFSEKMRAEANVVQRIVDLQKEGMWYDRRLPKSHEPPRLKSHWDYLLEEMHWLAADFAAERKWKRLAARKCAKMIEKYFSDKAIAEEKAKKEDKAKVIKIAQFMAREVRNFWSNAQKLVEFKEQSRIEELKKKAMDQHLSFIVDQTEKISTMLAESFALPGETKEERVDELSESEHQSVAASEPLLDLQDEQDYLPSGSESDVEDTIAEEERREGKGGGISYAAELRQLEDDSKLSIDELVAKYSKPPPVGEDKMSEVGASDFEGSVTTEVDEEDEEMSSNQGQGGESRGEEDDEESSDQQSNLVSLLQTFAPESAGEPGDKFDDELNTVAALAESFQPKGYTLSSTKVSTSVPFLLKHELREYQHIGLDWLVTMYEKKLNGILADEMGLGKTIQTIALLAHLACEKGNWGPHLIIVPTSVMLNWEMELKKWCPGFKILTYYGSIKERKIKRTGWTKPNTFHICITSYKIILQDHQTFRRKRWKYLILDEAQNIKNFKSQRWQLLLNFSTQRRLLLTGTPLQNNLMELWSLMHFLMPHVFQSHREFREWFSNPVSGMIEGSSDYNETIIKRLHKVLRPFILRRLKSEVEKQLPKKFEHVVMCRLSKRQRFLYEDFMSRTKTRETLQTGNLLSVINVLMQLRKVCNHPNLFESRPIISPLQTMGITFLIPSLVWNLDLTEEQVQNLSLCLWRLTQDEERLDKWSANTIYSLRAPRSKFYIKDGKLVEEIFPQLELQPLSKTDESLPPVRKIIHTLNKPDPPILPKAKNPFSVFTLDKMPEVLFFQSKEFIDAVSSSDPPCFNLTPSDFLNTLSSAPSSQLTNGISTSEQKGFKIPKVRTTKLSSSTYKKLASTSDGCDIYIASSGLTIVHNPKANIDSSIPTIELNHDSSNYFDDTKFEVEISAKARGKLVVNPSTSSLITPIQQHPNNRLKQVHHQDEDEESDEYEDSDEEFTQPPKKIIKLDTTTMKKADKTPRRPSTYGTTTRRSSVLINYLDEEDDYEDDDEVQIIEEKTNNKRKRVTEEFVRLPKVKRLDQTIFELESIEYRKLNDRKTVIENLRRINAQRLIISPVYGKDLLDNVSWTGKSSYSTRNVHGSVYFKRPKRNYNSHGYYNFGFSDVMNLQRIKTNVANHPYDMIWRHTSGLNSLVLTLEEAVERLDWMLKRFIIHTPAVSAPRTRIRVFRPHPSRYERYNKLEETLSSKVKDKLEIFHPIVSQMSTQFPDPRLIQYDCGKLQVLDSLLRRLKSENHRVLIFTQMARMLDVLEVFLNHHGYIYLRLDGSTRIDQRQLLMEKFNTDKRVFVFILSTRSGGIGVNLTGADTVIFYDSDWNPTMDAQAQDRCHRIGQTRDVHIYRLVSEKTIEENILKKSNQKRLLGELAIEGGNFTTAHFQKKTIHELFDVDVTESDVKKRMAELLESPPHTPAPVEETEESVPANKASRSVAFIESVLAAAEDESDVRAARNAKAEAAAELAEFDENIPLEQLVDGNVEERSKVDEEMELILNELLTVERYAIRLMESTIDDWSKETVANAQKEIEQQKREWELEQMKKEEAERQAAAEREDEEEIDDLLTYSSIDAHNQVWCSLDCESEMMPLWAPPTPPQDEDDVYFDVCQALLYGSQCIPEYLLPPVWEGPKKPKLAPTVVAAKPGAPPAVVEELSNAGTLVDKKGSTGTIKPHRRDEPIFAPRSLFDRPSPALAKLRRDYKIQKITMGSRAAILPLNPVAAAAAKTLGPGSITFPITPNATKITSAMAQIPPDILDWSALEDYALLQSITGLLELPANLLIVNLAQTTNWDLSSEVVNLVSKTHRSVKQCKQRYEFVVLPREEGKILEPIPVKKKKVKAAPPTAAFIKISPPNPAKARRLKTSELVANDNNQYMKNVFLSRFDSIKAIANKKSPTTKNPTFTPTVRQTKQSSIFLEHGINYEVPVSATVIACLKFDRLLAERTKLLQAQRAALAEQIEIGIQQSQQKIRVNPQQTLVMASPNISEDNKQIQIVHHTLTGDQKQPQIFIPQQQSPGMINIASLAMSSQQAQQTLPSGIGVESASTLTPMSQLVQARVSGSTIQHVPTQLTTTQAGQTVVLGGVSPSPSKQQQKQQIQVLTTGERPKTQSELLAQHQQLTKILSSGVTIPGSPILTTSSSRLVLPNQGMATLTRTPIQNTQQIQIRQTPGKPMTLTQSLDPSQQPHTVQIQQSQIISSSQPSQTVGMVQLGQTLPDQQKQLLQALQDRKTLTQELININAQQQAQGKIITSGVGNVPTSLGSVTASRILIPSSTNVTSRTNLLQHSSSTTPQQLQIQSSPSGKQMILQVVGPGTGERPKTQSEMIVQHQQLSKILSSGITLPGTTVVTTASSRIVLPNQGLTSLTRTPIQTLQQPPNPQQIQIRQTPGKPMTSVGQQLDLNTHHTLQIQPSQIISTSQSQILTGSQGNQSIGIVPMPLGQTVQVHDQQKQLQVIQALQERVKNQELLSAQVQAKLISSSGVQSSQPSVGTTSTSRILIPNSVSSTIGPRTTALLQHGPASQQQIQIQHGQSVPVAGKQMILQVVAGERPKTQSEILAQHQQLSKILSSGITVPGVTSAGNRIVLPNQGITSLARTPLQQHHAQSGAIQIRQGAGKPITINQNLDPNQQHTVQIQSSQIITAGQSNQPVNIVQLGSNPTEQQKQLQVIQALQERAKAQDLINAQQGKIITSGVPGSQASIGTSTTSRILIPNPNLATGPRTTGLHQHATASQQIQLRHPQSKQVILTPQGDTVSSSHYQLNPSFLLTTQSGTSPTMVVTHVLTPQYLTEQQGSGSGGIGGGSQGIPGMISVSTTGGGPGILVPSSLASSIGSRTAVLQQQIGTSGAQQIQIRQPNKQVILPHSSFLQQQHQQQQQTIQQVVVSGLGPTTIELKDTSKQGPGGSSDTN